MLARIRAWWRLLNEAAFAVELLIVFVFVLYPLVWLERGLRKLGVRSSKR